MCFMCLLCCATLFYMCVFFNYLALHLTFKAKHVLEEIIYKIKDIPQLLKERIYWLRWS